MVSEFACLVTYTCVQGVCGVYAGVWGVCVSHVAYVHVAGFRWLPCVRKTSAPEEARREAAGRADAEMERCTPRWPGAPPAPPPAP